MAAVVKHHSVEPAPVWRKLYLMQMNERETFLRFPKQSFEWWLRHDNWTVSTKLSRPKPMLEWDNVVFRERCTTKYADIPVLDFL